MVQACLMGVAVLLLGLQPQQFPPPTVRTSPHPTEERRLPIDQPEVITTKSKHRRVDTEQLSREASELANLADEIPSLVQKANKGLLSKDLNERLKRIEKLSKQLRHELAL